MKINSHKSSFIANTFPTNDNKKDKKINKQKQNKTENTQLRLKKK